MVAATTMPKASTGQSISTDPKAGVGSPKQTTTMARELANQPEWVASQVREASTATANIRCTTSRSLPVVIHQLATMVPSSSARPGATFSSRSAWQW